MTKYGLRHIVSLIPGDGIGRELCQAVRTVFAALRVPVDFEELALTGHTVDKTAALESAIASIQRNRVALKGIFYTAPEGAASSLNVALRRRLDLYANVVAIRSLGSGGSRHRGVDFVVVRENMEGEYAGLEHESIPGVIESLKVVTRANSERIVKHAFDYALQHGRRRVTCVHKANIMSATDA